MPWAKAKNGERGLVFLGSASPSAASTSSFNSVFTSAYSNYKIVYNLTAATGSQGIWIRFRANGTDDSTSATMGSVASYLNVISGSFTSNVSGSAGDNKMLLGRINTNASGGSVDIIGPQKTTYKTIVGVTWSSHVPGVVDGTAYYVGGQNIQTTQYDGFTLFPTASTMTGNIFVYGYTE